MPFQPEPAHQQLADWVASRHHRGQRVFGLCGSQGSGKSTVALWLVDALAQAQLRAVVVSIDDLYLPRADRAQLARTVHPLLQTRGVPGTHDSEQGKLLLDTLPALGTGSTLAAPRFDKAADDRAADPQQFTGPIDVVLFEGWCVGLPAQRADALAAPINALEREQDADGAWRRSVNQALVTDYADWFSRLDALIFLQAPDFETVFAWRWQQEQDTIAAAGGPTDQTFTPETLNHFLAHYERLTRHALDVMPRIAAARLVLDAEHLVAECHLSE